MLTALMSGGALAAFALSAGMLRRGLNPHRLAALGALVGVVAFSFVIFAEPLEAPWLFRAGTVLIGLGGGFFSVGTLSAAMTLESQGMNGLAIGAWGAVQATAAGLAIAAGGLLRDLVSGLATSGGLGPVLDYPGVGYSAVYHIELILLFATLAAVGPLVRHARGDGSGGQKFGLAEFPG
jgi:BCD family chlorophyll transporter-like MFS transporter